MAKLVLAGLLQKLTSRKLWATVAADSLAVTNSPLWDHLPPRYQWVRGVVIAVATGSYVLAEAIVDYARARALAPQTGIPAELTLALRALIARLELPAAPPPSSAAAPVQ